MNESTLRPLLVGLVSRLRTAASEFERARTVGASLLHKAAVSPPEGDRIARMVTRCKAYARAATREADGVQWLIEQRWPIPVDKSGDPE